MVLASKVIDYIVQSIDTSLEIVSVGSLVNGSQLVEVKSLKWLKIKPYVNDKLVTIQGNTITFTGLTQAFTLYSELNLQLPIFMSGTVTNTKYEWSRFESNERKKLPLVWLVSPSENSGSEFSNTYKLNTTIWFISLSDWTKLNKDREDESLQPLIELYNAFKKAITDSEYFSNFSESVRDFPKFGTETKDGVQKDILNSTLSAIECNITFDLLKSCKFG